MSKSLRTRPMTLYQSRDSLQPAVPPVPNDLSASQELSVPHTDKRKSGRPTGKNRALSKASEVGSNLKKRLSLRYAEPTELDAGGFSAIPQVPALPTVYPGAPDLPPLATAPAQYQSHSQLERGTNGRVLPILGEGFEDADMNAEPTGVEDGLNEDQSHSGPQPSLHGRTSLDGRKLSRGPLQLQNHASDPAVDLEMLSAEKFDPEFYLKMKLAHSSEDFLRQFQDSLRAVKDSASSDLKRQVFRNYQEFITISKEIATLENDMIELKELLSEWKTLPQTLELEEAEINGLGSLTDSALRGRSLRGNRSSMVDLHQIYKAQIQSLWEGIEGSQKFLPMTPGRHLIAEASSFTELNAATYKPRQQVALFLLNDLILVAVRKKRQMSSRVRLVAERCFTLEEVIVIDLKDGGDLTNAIKIKQGKENFVYRTERSEDKRALLNAFRRVAEELANKRRKKNLAEAEARKRESTYEGNDALGVERVNSGNLQGTLDVSMTSNDKDTSRMQAEFTDRIAVAIALREWGEAVSLIEQGQSKLSAQDNIDLSNRELSFKLRTLTSQLVEAVCNDLSSPLLKKSSVVRNVGYLLRLDRGERAREIFLNSRSELLKRRSRQIKFEGDVSLYVSELALVHFTLIKNTSEWYMSAFKDNHMGFVRWAAIQIESYAEIFRRQVYGMVNQDPKVVAEAIDITMSSASQLKEVGLDLIFYLKELLQKPGRKDGFNTVPSLTVTLADDPEAIAKRLSAIEIRQQNMTEK